MPLYTAVMTYIGFYILGILGYLHQLLFTPKVATERHRDVSGIVNLSNLSTNNIFYKISFNTQLEIMLELVGTEYLVL